MKCSLKSAVLLTALFSVAVGVWIGWWGKGMVTARGSGPQGTAPPTVEISRTSNAPTGTPPPQNHTGVNAEEPKAVAKRLLQEVLDGSTEMGSEELLKFRFQQALAGCDEAAVLELVEMFIPHAKYPWIRDFSLYPLPTKFSELMVMRMAAHNPQKALNCQVALAQAGRGVSPGDFSMIMELLSEQDSIHVQNVIEGLPPGDVRISVEIAWLQARAKNDPEGVFQYLMNLDAAALAYVARYESVMGDLLQKLAVQDPRQAIQVCGRFPAVSFYSLRGDLLRGWLEREPTAAAQWAMEQNDAAMFNACFQYYGHRNGALDEELLRANFLTIQSTYPAARVQLAQTLAERLAIKDIPESIRWAATLPTEAREEANFIVATAWIQTDVPAAAQWLKSWPEGGSRDKAVSRLVGSLVAQDPEAALAWAASMKSSDRYERMQFAMNALTFENSAAAERALQMLSEEDRGALSVLKRHNLEIK